MQKKAEVLFSIWKVAAGMSCGFFQKNTPTKRKFYPEKTHLYNALIISRHTKICVCINCHNQSAQLFLDKLFRIWISVELWAMTGAVEESRRDQLLFLVVIATFSSRGHSITTWIKFHPILTCYPFLKRQLWTFNIILCY